MASNQNHLLLLALLLALLIRAGTAIGPTQVEAQSVGPREIGGPCWNKYIVPVSGCPNDIEKSFFFQRIVIRDECCRAVNSLPPQCFNEIFKQFNDDTFGAGVRAACTGKNKLN
ncbi:hypothetical protein Ancab_015700 [Ancistrocladus abbreviatus]